MNNKTLALNSLNSALGNTRGIGEIGRAGTSRVKKENRAHENTKGKGESSGERKHKQKKEQSGARELQGERGNFGCTETPRG